MGERFTMNQVTTFSDRRRRKSSRFSPQQEDNIDFGALLSTIWRGKWAILAITLLAVAGAGGYLRHLATPLYRATTVLILETRQQTVVDIEGVLAGLDGDSVTINSETEVLHSRSLMGEVVDRLALTTEPEFNPALRDASYLSRARSFIYQAVAGAPPVVSLPPAQRASRARTSAIDTAVEKTRITALPNSLVFRIEASSEDPDLAARLADTIAEIYISNQLRTKREATRTATTWLQSQVARLGEDLEHAEARLIAFTTDTELVSLEALQALGQKLKGLRDRVEDSSAEAAAVKAKLAHLTAAATRPEKARAAEDPQLTRLLARTRSEPRIAGAFDTRFAEVVQRARNDAARAARKLGDLQSSENALRTRIDAQGDDKTALQQLQREVAATRELYEYFLGRLKETSAQHGIQKADSRILSHAVTPLTPAAPRQPLVLMMAAMSGILGGGALVLLREAGATGFRCPAELERFTGISVVGQIPRIPVRGNRKILPYLTSRPASATAEAYRDLRTSILQSNLNAPPQVLLSTSALSGEGKTTNSLAIAQNFAGLGRRVILVEGDIRRRTFHRYFPQVPAAGLVSVLQGTVNLDEAVLCPTGFGAGLLMGEQTASNAADLFSSGAFKALIARLRDSYDTIVIDAPPVLIVPDARIIAQEVDAVLFTVKWNSTTQAQLEEGLRLFAQGNRPVSGLVLSQIDARGMKRYGFAGSYGAYSAQGAPYYAN